MTPFAWLCLAHFVGDWLLQNDWMAREKRGRWWSAACLVHCTVYTLTLTVTFVALAGPWDSGSMPRTLAFAAAIFLSHWLLDGFNIPVWWNRLVGQTDTDLVRIVVDQTMHLMVVAILVELLLGR
jgi:hypothetical protein